MTKTKLKKFMRIDESFEVGERVVPWDVLGSEEWIVGDNNIKNPVLVRPHLPINDRVAISMRVYRVDKKQGVYQTAVAIEILPSHPDFNRYKSILFGGLR